MTQSNRCNHCDNDIDAVNSRSDCDRCGTSCCDACLLPPRQNPLECWCSLCLRVDSGELKPDYLAAHLRNKLIDVNDRLSRLERRQGHSHA
jgi:hypothetical protein